MLFRVHRRVIVVDMSRLLFIFSLYDQIALFVNNECTFFKVFNIPIIICVRKKCPIIRVIILS